MKKAKQPAVTVSLTLRPALYEAVRLAAEAENRSVAGYVREAVRAALERDSKI